MVEKNLPKNLTDNRKEIDQIDQKLLDLINERSKLVINAGKIKKKSGDKTVSVLVTRQTTHPIYKKIIRLSKKYLAHDNDNSISVGDSVKIQETRPLSKSKYWEVIK